MDLLVLNCLSRTSSKKFLHQCIRLARFLQHNPMATIQFFGDEIGHQWLHLIRKVCGRGNEVTRCNKKGWLIQSVACFRKCCSSVSTEYITYRKSCWNTYLIRVPCSRRWAGPCTSLLVPRNHRSQVQTAFESMLCPIKHLDKLPYEAVALLTSEVTKAGGGATFPSVNHCRKPPSAPMYFFPNSASVEKKRDSADSHYFQIIRACSGVKSCKNLHVHSRV
jgi:hypothetical protein